MAVNPIRFLTSTSVTATNGSNIITVTGSVDASAVFSGTAVFVAGREPVEAVSGTAYNPSTMVSTITLRDNWSQPTTTGAMVVFNTIEGLGEAIRLARNIVNDGADLQTSFNTLFTSTDPTVDIVLNGVTISVVPYGFLAAEVQTLINTAGNAADQLAALQMSVTTLQTTVDGLQDGIDADLLAAQTARAGAETAETAAELAETNINASLVTFNSDLSGFNTDFGTFTTNFGTFGTDFASFNTDFGTFTTNFGTFGTDFASFNTDFGTFTTNLGTFNTDFATFTTNFGTFTTDFATIGASVTAAQTAETNAEADRVSTLGFRNEAETFRDEAQQAAASVSGGIFFAGDFDASAGNAPPDPAANVGNPSYRISVAGTISSIDYAIGDSIVWNGTGYFKRQTSDVTVSSIGAATSAQGLLADNAIPNTGGSLTGPIDFTSLTGDVIRFNGDSAIRRLSSGSGGTGGGILIGSDHTFIAGSGESAGVTAAGVAELEDEQSYITSDNNVYIFTDMQGGFSGRRTFTFGEDGELSIGATRVSESIAENKTRTLQNEATQTITRTTQTTEINVWSVTAIYTLDESTFLVGDKVIVRKLYRSTPVVTVITDDGAIIFPDETTDSTVTLEDDATFTIELLKVDLTNWLLTVRN